jgi:hypothetical protein
MPRRRMIGCGGTGIKASQAAMRTITVAITRGPVGLT